MVECPAGKLAGFFMRFTIRDLLWLTVVVAFSAGWLAQRDETIKERELAAKRLADQKEESRRQLIELKDMNRSLTQHASSLEKQIQQLNQ